MYPLVHDGSIWGLYPTNIGANAYTPKVPVRRGLPAYIYMESTPLYVATVLCKVAAAMHGCAVWLLYSRKCPSDAVFRTDWWCTCAKSCVSIGTYIATLLSMKHETTRSKTMRPRRIAQVVWFQKVDDDHYQALIRFSDGTEESFGHLTETDWVSIKRAEMTAELIELEETPRPELISDRTGHPKLRKIQGQLTVRNPYADINPDTIDTGEDNDVHDRLHEVERWHLYDGAMACAWCRCFINRETGRVLMRMNDREFAHLSTIGGSHSICPACKDKLSAEVKVRRTI